MPERNQAPTPTRWLATVTEHEGFPIALRIRCDANTPANRKQYSLRLALIHHLAHVQPNGLPEPKYNKGLAEFDHAVHECVESAGDALVVLVETFARRRIYFSYVRSENNVDARLDALKKKNPQHAIEIRPIRSDPDWEAFEHYKKTFPW